MANEPEIWDPFRRMRKVRRTMVDMFSMPEFFGEIRPPLIDVADKGKSLQVIAELPGTDKKDIDLNVESDAVEIKAEAKDEAKEEKEKEGYYFHERNYQSFFRRIPLPTKVIASNAKASFKNGVLTIDLPKKHASKKAAGKKVRIQ